MNKVYYTADHINSFLLNITKQMYKDNFYPDYIVGITRGGLVPALKLSHYLDIPMQTLDKDMSNLWMAEEAFGYVNEELRDTYKSRWDVSLRKKILVIDDINDTGATFSNLVADWESGCFPKESTWKTVWHNNVKFASTIYNESSTFESDYYGKLINKVENPEWCVFPWEEWWITN